jgi:phosphoglucosamine mutase
MRAQNIDTIQTKVGDRYVVEAMRANGYSIGGEQSGHIVMLDHATTGDGLLAALRVLSLVARSEKPLSELASVMEKLPQVLINFRVDRKIPISELPQATQKIDEISKAYGDTGRVLVRYSGTEPKCRVMLEGPDMDRLEKDANTIADIIAKETSA